MKNQRMTNLLKSLARWSIATKLTVMAAAGIVSMMLAAAAGLTDRPHRTFG
jgi:hypothetical protein